LDINVLGKVPAIKVEGKGFVCESLVINEYLEAKFG